MNISNYQSESAECFEHSDTLQSRENVTRQHVFRERHFRDSNLRFSTPAATLRREQSREKEFDWRFTVAKRKESRIATGFLAQPLSTTPITPVAGRRDKGPKARRKSKQRKTPVLWAGPEVLPIKRGGNKRNTVEISLLLRARRGLSLDKYRLASVTHTHTGTHVAFLAVEPDFAAIVTSARSSSFCCPFFLLRCFSLFFFRPFFFLFERTRRDSLRACLGDGK